MRNLLHGRYGSHGLALNQSRTARICGLYSTGSIDLACWFAHRFRLPDSVVYQVTVAEKRVLAHVNREGPHEYEYILLLPPTVYPQRILSASETVLRGEAKRREIENR